MVNERANVAELNNPRIDFLILADRAEAVNGKLYMMGGGWDRNHVEDIAQPITISFALGILVPWTAANQHYPVMVTIENQDRVPLAFRVEAEFVVGRPPNAILGETQRFTLAFPGVPVRFPAYGSYCLVANIVGIASRRVDFHIINPQGIVPGSRQ